MKWIVIACCLLLSATIITGQETTPEVPPEAPEVNADNLGIVDAYLFTNASAPAIGEPFELSLIIDVPSTVTIEIWPEFPEDDLLEVLEADEPIETVDNERIVYEQQMTAVIWDAGPYFSPELVVGYRVSGGDLQSDPVRSIFLTIPTTINPDDPPRPSAPTVDLAFIPRWIYGIAVAIGILVILLVARLIQNIRQSLTRVLVGTNLQTTIAQLEDLRQQDLPASTLYPLVANNLRQFLVERFDINAVEMTTDELINVLKQGRLLNNDHLRQLKQVLEQADLVKFARFQPDDRAKERLIRFAIAWVRAVSRYERQAA